MMNYTQILSDQLNLGQVNIILEVSGVETKRKRDVDDWNMIKSPLRDEKNASIEISVNTGCWRGFARNKSTTHETKGRVQKSGINYLRRRSDEK